VSSDVPKPICFKRDPGSTSADFKSAIVRQVNDTSAKEYALPVVQITY
jgi:hypothetical protein